MEWIFEMLENKESRRQAAADRLVAHHPGLTQSEAIKMAREAIR